MSNLKIKLKYKSFEIELEGDKETVQTEFNNIKEKGLGNIFNGVDIAESTYIIEANQNSPLATPETLQLESSTLPSLKSIIMDQLPSTEAEWVLIYCYYVSKYGNESFTSKSILEMYDTTNRRSDSRKANLSNNFKTLHNKKYISALNDEEYIMTSLGKQHVSEILNRASSPSPDKITNPKKKKKENESKNLKKTTNTTSQKAYSIIDVNFVPKNNKNLKTFFGEYVSKTNFDNNILILHYLKNIINEKNVGINHIYTAYKHLGIKIPNILASLRDMKRLKGWVDLSNIDDIKIAIAGENYIEHDIPKK